MSDHSGDDLVARGKTIVDSGKHAPARGELLGTITGWVSTCTKAHRSSGDALRQEQESGC